MALSSGAALGFLAWAAAGGASASSAKLEPLQARVSALRSARSSAFAPAGADVAALASAPIFTLTTGPQAVPQPLLRLDGLVRARGRVAALLSINDKPAEWLALGETRDGVLLQEVMSAKVVVETLYGPQEVALGERPAGAAPVAQGSPPSAAGPQAMDQIPPGFRSPPPPASAPGTR